METFTGKPECHSYMYKLGYNKPPIHMCISPELSATRLNTRAAVITAKALGLWGRRGAGSRVRKGNRKGWRTRVKKGGMEGRG